MLLIDEVLAVGDVRFRSKCIDSISRLSNNAAVILVSHSMPSIARVAHRAVVLGKGRVKFDGSTSFAIQTYLKDSVLTHRNLLVAGLLTKCQVRICRVGELHGRSELSMEHGEGIEIEIILELDQAVQKCCVNIGIIDEEMQPILQVYSGRSGYFLANDKSPIILRVTVRNLPLRNGRYSLNVYFVEPEDYPKMGRVYGALLSAAIINVVDDFPGFAPVQLDATWQTK